MEIFNEISPLGAFLNDMRGQGKSIGLVLTMGALHEGHISLLEASKKENSLTICTIYVNPTQFNNPADLEKYPRTLEEDKLKLEKAGCDVLFCPSNLEMYPNTSLLTFDFGTLDKVMEGCFRPGHFSGVALVVSKFFNIITPTRAYFGQKDWQQLAVIKTLVNELKFGLTLRSVPTVREADGLAKSSRNQRLDAHARARAPIFYNTLCFAVETLKKGQSLTDVKAAVTDNFNQQGDDIRLEYFELVDSVNLTPLTDVEGENPPILCIAGYIGEIRLIDNMFLDLSTN